jgi:hypothetical protein
MAAHVHWQAGLSPILAATPGSPSPQKTSPCQTPAQLLPRRKQRDRQDVGFRLGNGTLSAEAGQAAAAASTTSCPRHKGALARKQAWNPADLMHGSACAAEQMG